MRPPPPSSRAAPVLIVGVVALATAVDFVTPPDFNPTVLHGIALAACGLVGRRRWVWPLAALLVLVGYAGLVWGPAPLQPHPNPWVLWGNRTLAAIATLTIAAIVDFWLRAQEHLTASRHDLEERNAALEASNADLSAREEEIARQNEELQSQSEELRIANDELASRERMLAQLLDLSRTLASELRRADVMTTICEALTDILTGSDSASTILLREGDRLVVRCHYGFGPEGPESRTIPFEHSFASLVIGSGQTGFLQDVALRPDLNLPRMRGGEVIRSVLGAPLWVRGQAIGALEVYSRHPHQWTEEQLGLITSMAAQASVSLETARLFEEVERERRRFETVFRTLPLGVLMCDDPSCQQISGNPAAAALFTVPLDANFSPFAPAAGLVRRSVFRTGRALAPEELPLVRAVQQGEELQAEELDILMPSGRRYTVLASAVPIYDGQGRVQGGVCVFADITARKALEREIEVRRREAEESSVRKTRFLGAVSHDIRTPANTIRLRAELIKRTASNPALAGKIPELAEELQASAVSLVELVGEVLDLTRLDTGRVELQETEFSLGETMAEECRHLMPVATAKGLRLECDAVDPPLWLHADRVKLARVIGNLIENGIKFTASGEVRLSAGTAPDGRVQIRVQDTGPGIPSEELGRIFDEFFQLRNPARDQKKGVGLGLAICKRLVDAMGGEIRVESGSGLRTTFTVSLPGTSVVPHPEPVHRPVPRTAVPDAPGGVSLAGVRVLVVEDHVSTRHDVAKLLDAEGAIVTQAADAQAALRALRETDPQIVLFDLMLPDFDGSEVLKAIRARRPTGPQTVFVLTGDSATRQVAELERLGADVVVKKPIEPEQLPRPPARSRARDLAGFRSAAEGPSVVRTGRGTAGTPARRR